MNYSNYSKKVIYFIHWGLKVHSTNLALHFCGTQESKSMLQNQTYCLLYIRHIVLSRHNLAPTMQLNHRQWMAMLSGVLC